MNTKKNVIYLIFILITGLISCDNASDKENKTPEIKYNSEISPDQLIFLLNNIKCNDCLNKKLDSLNFKKDSLSGTYIPKYSINLKDACNRINFLSGFGYSSVFYKTCRKDILDSYNLYFKDSTEITEDEVFLEYKYYLDSLIIEIAEPKKPIDQTKHILYEIIISKKE